jgi:hypothetical protein
MKLSSAQPETEILCAFERFICSLGVAQTVF